MTSAGVTYGWIGGKFAPLPFNRPVRFDSEAEAGQCARSLEAVDGALDLEVREIEC